MQSLRPIGLNPAELWPKTRLGETAILVRQLFRNHRELGWKDSSKLMKYWYIRLIVNGNCLNNDRKHGDRKCLTIILKSFQTHTKIMQTSSHNYTKIMQKSCKIMGKSSQHHPKIIPKSFQNHDNIIPTSSPNHPRIISEFLPKSSM